MGALLKIDNLHASSTSTDETPGTQILTGLNLEVQTGEIHAIMGPNGSGKSTLSNTLLGSSEYEVTDGTISYLDEVINDWDTEVRGREGIFLAFQYPQEISGVSILNFLRQALSARKGMEMSVLELRLLLMEWMEKLGINETFLERYLNEGFSGGEKKRNEILQMAILEPQLAILDETDSGLDIDALQTIATGVKNIQKERPDLSVVAITHYQRLLDYLEPDYVHIMIDGKIIESGDISLAKRLEKSGYDDFKMSKT